MRNLSRNRIPTWLALFVSIFIALVYYRHRWGILGIVGIGPFPPACESVEALEDYLSGGGDPSAYLGYTPLIMCATEAGSEEVVAKLIEIGVNVDAQKGAFPLDMVAEERSTALYFAVREDHQRIAELLVEAGADVNLSGAGTRSPLNTAIFYNRPEILDFFLSVDLEQYEFDPIVFWHPAERGYVEVFEVLINHGVQFGPEFINSLRDTVGNGQSVVKLLLENSDAEIFESLHNAILEGNFDIARFLIEDGRNVNVKNENGSTPLHFAAIQNQIEGATLLIENGADLNIKNAEGQTPLDIAIAQNHSEIADLLRAAGAKSSE